MDRTRAVRPLLRRVATALVKLGVALQEDQVILAVCLGSQAREFRSPDGGYINLAEGTSICF